ncbi:MAG: hypothetical protein ACOYJO_02295 [Eubacterium sp.]|jgi:hypothetical protein
MDDRKIEDEKYSADMKEQMREAARPSFGAVFFRIYDRKIASGEITFKSLGMDKNDFTMLCTVRGFVPADEVIEHLCETMKLSSEERELFMSYRKR